MFESLRRELEECCDLLRNPFGTTARCKTPSDVVAFYLACDTPWVTRTADESALQELSLSTTLGNIYSIIRLCNVFCCEGLPDRWFNELLLLGLNRLSEMPGNPNSNTLPRDLRNVTRESIAATRYFFSTVLVKSRIRWLHMFLKDADLDVLLSKVFLSDLTINENVTDYLVCDRMYETAVTTNSRKVVWSKTLVDDLRKRASPLFDRKSGKLDSARFQLVRVQKTKMFSISINGVQSQAKIELHHVRSRANGNQHHRFCRLVTPA